MNTKTKSIGWSYPTSPNADRFGFKGGCYTVEITVHTPKGPKPPKALAGFKTRAEAESFAASLPEAWDASRLVSR